MGRSVEVLLSHLLAFAVAILALHLFPTSLYDAFSFPIQFSFFEDEFHFCIDLIVLLIWLFAYSTEVIEFSQLISLPTVCVVILLFSVCIFTLYCIFQLGLCSSELGIWISLYISKFYWVLLEMVAGVLGFDGLCLDCFVGC